MWKQRPYPVQQSAHMVLSKSCITGGFVGHGFTPCKTNLASGQKKKTPRKLKFTTYYIINSDQNHAINKKFSDNCEIIMKN
jgi:hypothetical protein